MPLIKCADCGNDISDKAVTCPACGAVIRKPREKRTTSGKDKTKGMQSDLWLVNLPVIALFIGSKIGFAFFCNGCDALYCIAQNFSPTLYAIKKDLINSYYLASLVKALLNLNF